VPERVEPEGWKAEGGLKDEGWKDGEERWKDGVGELVGESSVKVRPSLEIRLSSSPRLASTSNCDLSLCRHAKLGAFVMVEARPSVAPLAHTVTSLSSAANAASEAASQNDARALHSV